MRGALIGCGFFAQNHLNAWRDMRAEGVDLVAVCDIDPAKAKAAADAFGIARHYTDARALFETEKLDFVDISTRMDTHKALALAAIGKGVRTIVQKPFAPDWRDCVEIVTAAKLAGVPLAIHENFRFQTPMRRLKATLDSGVIGNITWGRISFRTCYDIYRNQPYFHQEKRFAILDLGIHVLDLARVLLGEVERLSCETQRRNPKNLAEDTATMLLRHTNGAVSVVEHSYESKQVPDPFPQTMIIVEGDRGSVKMHEDFRMVVTSDGQATETRVGSPLLPWTEEPWHTAQESVLRCQQAILGAWREGREAETSGEDNLKTFALAEAAYESAASHRAVRPARLA